MSPTAFSFNTTVDVRADAIVFPRSVREVQDAVNDARRRGLRVAAQATGHNVAPYGSLRGAVLVDVRHLQDVQIDPLLRRVRVGAGVKWERVTPQLSALGLAGLHGSSPDVGIAGYSLGGGIGWVSRKFGMQSNAVTAIELVLADGRHVRTDHDHEPELFWALRGGNGNFGVVTAIEFEVHPVAELYAGAMFFPFARAGEVLHAWAGMLPSLPEELTTWVSLLHFPPDPALPDHLRGGSFAVVQGAFLGGEDEGRRLLRAVRDLGPQFDTFAMSPTEVLGDLAMDPPEPLPFAMGHRLMTELPAEAVDAILAVAGPDSGAPLAMVQIRHMGGALHRVAPGAGARATLPGDLIAMALGVTPEADAVAPVRAAIEAFEDATRPWDAGDYPNFVERPADASTFFDPVTWARLQQAKATYDPDGLLRGNHEIRADEAQGRLAA